MLTTALTKVADRLFELGAVKTYAEGEWRKLKDGSLSPIFLNLRVPENMGDLDQQAVEWIAQLLYQVIMEEGIEFRYYSGLPRAGEPFADALEKLLDPEKYQRLHMVKVGEGDERRISHFDESRWVDHGMEILLIDDLITQATTKLEAAKVARNAGLNVAAFVVFVDREQGGTDRLEEDGETVYSVTTLIELLDYYESSNQLDTDTWKQIRAYLGKPVA